MASSPLNLLLLSLLLLPKHPLLNPQPPPPPPRPPRRSQIPHLLSCSSPIQLRLRPPVLSSPAVAPAATSTQRSPQPTSSRMPTLTLRSSSSAQNPAWRAKSSPLPAMTTPPIPSARLFRPFLNPVNLLLPFSLLRSIFISWTILRRFRPQIVLGTGSYVAAPVCFAAALAGIKFVIQEQNSFPGLTNRSLAPYAEKIFLAFNACVKYFPKEKCVVSGNPVRLALRRYVSKAVARSHFFPKASAKNGDEKAQVVLVLGGSSGAYALNIAVLNMYYEMLLEHKNRYIIWQTGADGYNEMESLVKNNRRLLLTPFLHSMDLAYAAADVVVSRAGAMTCTEILTTGKPSILIPSPTVADDHQTKNAYIMADVAGSKVIPQDELDSSCLEIAINEVLGDEKLMAEMSEKALSVARPNASAEIAQDMLSLIRVSAP
ncbi:UDP-N-acetylglucosamine--N-acetylmuramyl-(pentapeptide) pyrophosphoryl-undecaprenol N-acetylglucosamine transferase-like [Dioscorea cayenensis subsp. rotundata]|uniref:UDP-N-acetylglucosamine--N-acetylmuramyl- (Pentapeptide) pyrophosphoryl-undecaprenol N-acetylglucosamine transferase-like n=1 Tax=Dioscorea cayennensis subsp. rotundata TaxID=55577 RepID=A0AB40ANE7_DIOCR|nr:UDP-N-acetylglucosamine--N-acetylmuramyl-(pentapeptide) pyrophosphoryl-undecaprenol N-acetylglucosamine transferase-like [Dioscorea cayenensis subsp. rotundata]